VLAPFLAIPEVPPIPWEEPAKATDGFAKCNRLERSPKETKPPNTLPKGELLKRDITIGPSTCGWITGDLDRKFAPILLGMSPDRDFFFCKFPCPVEASTRIRLLICTDTPI
jgi:hypothetical protein